MSAPIVIPFIIVTVPVNVGDAPGAFKSNAVCVAVETGLSISDVLSAKAKYTMDLVIPLTTPVNVGESILALEFINDWVAVETGLDKSDVLSTLSRPTLAFVSPLTVPVKVVLYNVVIPVTFKVGHDTILLKVAFVELNDKAFEPLKNNYMRHHS